MLATDRLLVGHSVTIFNFHDPPPANHGPRPPMHIHAVTFDFHNTLVSGDAWLDLEIRTLPGVVIRRLVARGKLPAGTATPAVQAAAEAAYRAVRAAATVSGQETAAVAGVWRVLTELELTAGLDVRAVQTAVRAAQQACLADTALVPGAAAALAAVQATGRRLAVISSAAYAPFVRWGLARHGLATYFPVVATSAGTGYYKSDPRLYVWALRRLGVAAAAAVHIGDHPRWDVQGAQAAGMRAVWLARGPAARPSASLTACRPDATIRDLADLPAALAALDDS